MIKGVNSGIITKFALYSSSSPVPEEFMYNPLTRSYGEPHKRPEVQNSTVEFIASSDYMVTIGVKLVLEYICVGFQFSVK